MPSEIKKPSFNSYYVHKNKVPDGFVKWYEILEKNNSKLMNILDTYLYNNELNNAVSIFQIATQKNINKIWH